MVRLTDLDNISDIKFSKGASSGAVKFKLLGEFHYRKVFNLYGKGVTYIIFRGERYDVNDLVLNFKKGFHN